MRSGRGRPKDSFACTATSVMLYSLVSDLRPFLAFLRDSERRKEPRDATRQNAKGARATR